jgi:hypothetical protein
VSVALAVGNVVLVRACTVASDFAAISKALDGFLGRRGEFRSMSRLSSSGAPQKIKRGDGTLINAVDLVVVVVSENVRCKFRV